MTTQQCIECHQPLPPGAETGLCEVCADFERAIEEYERGLIDINQGGHIDDYPDDESEEIRIAWDYDPYQDDPTPDPRRIRGGVRLQSGHGYLRTGRQRGMPALPVPAGDWGCGSMSDLKLQRRLRDWQPQDQTTRTDDTGIIKTLRIQITAMEQHISDIEGENRQLREALRAARKRKQVQP